MTNIPFTDETFDYIISASVIQYIRNQDIMENNVKEESISIARLKNANKIYLTNSFFGLREVILK